MSRSRWTHAFLWLSVTSWGIGLGAKLFDLLVLASAWGAAPPASLVLYPYGRNWPINPGAFFQPLSALILIASLGALISGWNADRRYRPWLLFPNIAFLLVWISTPAVFWPMIGELYDVANGRITRTDAQVTMLVQQWFLFDWARLAAIAVGFLSSIRAISVPSSIENTSSPGRTLPTA